MYFVLLAFPLISACGNEGEKMGERFGKAFNFGMEQGACDLAAEFPSALKFAEEDSGFFLDLIREAKARKNLNIETLKNDMRPADYGRLWNLVRDLYIEENRKLSEQNAPSLSFQFEDYMEHTLTAIIKISAVENPGQFNWNIVSVRKSNAVVNNQPAKKISALAVKIAVSKQSAETKTIKSCDYEK
jgi:hypothetical protein